MLSQTKPLILVIDDNSADIEIFQTAWNTAGHHESIAIHPCASCGPHMQICDAGLDETTGLDGMTCVRLAVRRLAPTEVDLLKSHGIPL